MIYKELVNLENLFQCWREFKKGKSGRLDILSFEFYLEDNIFKLHRELVNCSYRHSPYEQFHIWDPKHRLISKAGVRDRLVHHIVFAALTKIFDKTFIYHSYSSRLDKGTHLAVVNLNKVLRQVSRNYRRPVYALKCDIKKFFDSVSHQKLLAIIKKRLKDRSLLWLIGEIVGSFVKPVDKNSRERAYRLILTKVYL